MRATTGSGWFLTFLLGGGCAVTNPPQAVIGFPAGTERAWVEALGLE
jgi:hypothetical protein